MHTHINTHSHTCTHRCEIDIRNGETSYQQWASSPETYRALGDMFRNECNLAMAAELYGMASELYSRSLGPLEKSTKAQKKTLCSYVMRRINMFICLEKYCLFYCFHIPYLVVH